MARLSRTERQLHHTSASSTEIKEGMPTERDGNEGDITLRHIRGKGVYIFVRFRNRWYSRQLLAGKARSVGVGEVGLQNPMPSGSSMNQMIGYNDQTGEYTQVDVGDIGFGSPGKLSSVRIGDATLGTTGSGASSKLTVTPKGGTAVTVGSAITVQTGNPSAISEFDSVSFIYGTDNNRLYHKVDSNTMAYETMTEVSLVFSIDDVTFRTASSGGSETANAILVGTTTSMYLDVNYNNDDGTLDGNPTIYYKKNNASTGSGGSTDTGTGHLGTSVSSNSHTSSTAFVVPQTDNASDSSADGSFSRHMASGDYVTASVTSIDDTVSSTQVSERYYFVNGMIWGSCAATTGPTAAEFDECFSAGLNATGGKGYTLPTLSGGSFSDSQYHSNFGSRQITADSGSEYMFFGWPDQGGTASSIEDSSGTDISGDFRAVQTVGSTSTLPNSEGYMEVYNVYVSDNQGVNLEVTVT